MAPLRLLFVTPYVPSLLRTRPLGFIRGLARRGHRIWLLSAASSAAEARGIDQVRPFCEALQVVEVSRLRSWWNCATGVAGGVPLQALYSHSPALESALRELIARQHFDLAHVEHLRAALLGLSIQGVPRVFDAVDCISSLFERASRGATSAASRWRARVDLGRTQRFEGELLRRFDAALVSSVADRADLLALPGGGEAKLAVVPNGVDLDYFGPGSGARVEDELVFVGRMSYHANVAAAEHLVEHIMPLVWSARPSARVLIVGADPVASVEALARADARVTVTGGVPDVRPYLRRAALAVCPVVYGAGIQNKVLEAMACGTPVVASPAACEALTAQAGADLAQANGAEPFAKEIVRLLADEPARRNLGAAGRRFVEREHDWNLVVTRLEELYQDALALAVDRGGVEGSRGQR